MRAPGRRRKASGNNAAALPQNPHEGWRHTAKFERRAAVMPPDFAGTQKQACATGAPPVFCCRFLLHPCGCAEVAFFEGMRFRPCVQAEQHPPRKARCRYGRPPAREEGADARLPRFPTVVPLQAEGALPAGGRAGISPLVRGLFDRTWRSSCVPLLAFSVEKSLWLFVGWRFGRRSFGLFVHQGFARPFFRCRILPDRAFSRLP